ncbi:Conserved_hypothetical protein [Hexamita inflata]|uniref:Uncharacterized protein n=1 Tax=Hexamita inflata TaxID=28002 RepID=A0AA86ULI8_9EUKA|nr:Conserved hypothetical protein [Hexamita inflata]
MIIEWIISFAKVFQVTSVKIQCFEILRLQLIRDKLRDKLKIVTRCNISILGEHQQLQPTILQKLCIIWHFPFEVENSVHGKLKHLNLLNLQNNKVIFSAPLRTLKSELKLENNLIMDDKIQNKEKNQKKPELIDYQNFLGPNSTNEQVKELQTITDYNTEMKLKYQNAVQNESLNVENDTNVNDLGFTHELNVKIIQLKNCQNLQLPKTSTNHFKVNEGMICNYSEVRLVQIPTQIVQFSAGNCKLTNLVGLELLNNLKIIQIVDNPVTSLEPILGLRQVTSLTVNNSKLNSITGIKQMKQLVELNLCSNQIREISELGNLTNLSKLSLTSNKISDVSEIGKLTNLQKLELQNNDIHRINELRNLNKLTHVNLSNNKVIFSEPLNQLKIEILIDNNIVMDNVALKNQQISKSMNYKTFLGPNCTENQINELSAIASDFNYYLQMAQKYQNQVKNAELKIETDSILTDFGFTSEIRTTILTILNCKKMRLPVLQNVKYFKLSGGALVDYSEVKIKKVPSQITALTVNNCELNDLTGIELLVQLQKVELINNSFNNAKPLFSLINVTSLTINNSKLTNIIGIEQMRQLTYLNLKENQIVLIEPVKYLPNLKQLLLDNNFILDLNALFSLKLHFGVDLLLKRSIRRSYPERIQRGSGETNLLNVISQSIYSLFTQCVLEIYKFQFIYTSFCIIVRKLVIYHLTTFTQILHFSPLCFNTKLHSQEKVQIHNFKQNKNYLIVSQQITVFKIFEFGIKSILVQRTDSIILRKLVIYQVK